MAKGLLEVVASGDVGSMQIKKDSLPVDDTAKALNIIVNLCRMFKFSGVFFAIVHLLLYAGLAQYPPPTSVSVPRTVTAKALKKNLSTKPTKGKYIKRTGREKRKKASMLSCSAQCRFCLILNLESSVLKGKEVFIRPLSPSPSSSSSFF